jgi:hypothetical protein
MQQRQLRIIKQHEVSVISVLHETNFSVGFNFSHKFTKKPCYVHDLSESSFELSILPITAPSKLYSTVGANKLNI